MKWGDMLEFDSEEYQDKLKLYCDNHLRDNERTKRQERAGSATGMGVSVAAAVHTGGLSLLSGGISKRKHYVAGKKHKYILQEMEKRGLDEHEHKKRDWMVPMGASLVAGALASGVGMAMHDAAAQTAGQHAYDVVWQPTEVYPGYWVDQAYYVPDAAGNAAYAAFQSGEEEVVKWATKSGTRGAIKSAWSSEKSVSLRSYNLAFGSGADCSCLPERIQYPILPRLPRL